MGKQTKGSRVSRARVIAGIVLVVLILMLFGLGAVLVSVMRPPGAPKTGSLSPGMSWVRSIYGFGPRPEQQLLEPIGVAVDGRGRIYVSEPQRSRIVVFTRDGAFDGVITLMKSKDQLLARPNGMDLDEAGNLYVADEGMQRIVVFGPDRKWVRNIPDFVGSVRIVGDRLYGIGREHISIYNLRGELLSRFGKQGRAPGDLDGAYGFDVGKDGLLYVAEGFNKRVSVFKPSGELVRVLGRPATGSAGSAEDTSKPVFDLPTGLVFDGRGRLVELDAFLFQLSVFDTKGKMIGAYGTQGAADGSFIYPSSLAYDRNGDVFVIGDTRNNRVQVVRIDGSGSRRLDRMVPASFLQPACYGPLALLLLAIALTVALSRRRRLEETSPDADEEHEGVARGEVLARAADES